MLSALNQALANFSLVRVRTPMALHEEGNNHSEERVALGYEQHPATEHEAPQQVHHLEPVRLRRVVVVQEVAGTAPAVGCPGEDGPARLSLASPHK